MFITKDEYIEKAVKLDYWKNSYQYRWNYIKHIIDIGKRINPEKVLEIGTAGLGIFKGSYSVDKSLCYADVENSNFVLITDIRDTPLGFKDKEFDIVIGSQILEHLSPRQTEVFREISRIAHNSIITLPYKWKNYDDIHNGIDEDVIDTWTDGAIAKNKIIEGENIILHYEH